MSAAAAWFWAVILPGVVLALHIWWRQVARR